MEFVVRNLGGPTTAWLAGSDVKTTDVFNAKKGINIQMDAQLDKNAKTNSPSTTSRKLDVLIEGPYGSSSIITSLFSSITNPNEEILLLAGGVGATFTLPIYISLLRSAMPASTSTDMDEPEGPEATTARGTTAITAINKISPRIHFRWIVRSRDEAEWGIQYLRRAKVKMEMEAEAEAESEIPGVSKAANSSNDQLQEKEARGRRHSHPHAPPEIKMNVQIHITRQPRDPNPPQPDLDGEGLDKKKEEEEEEEADKDKDIPSTSLNPPHPPPSSPSPPLPLGISIIPASQPNHNRTTNSRPSLPTLIGSIFNPNPPPQPQIQPKKKASSPSQPSSDHHHHHKTTTTILICAPPSLTASARAAVTPHVLRRGRRVRWGEEAFGLGV